MWNDIETTDDLLNFQLVADTAAQLIQDSGNEPLSIGISGNWGSGKSSLVKMIGKSLEDDDEKYIFLEFNAWLYQGFDDAKIALLQSVSDLLLEEAQNQEKIIDKVTDLIKRVNWFKAIKLGAPAVYGALVGGTIGGPAGAFIGLLGGLFNGDGLPSEEEIKKVQEAYKEAEPELKGLIDKKNETSLPKEIAKLRQSFADILEELDIKLVVLVDDLDRCLPDTAISTLEAMRLLLFLPRTAFIIAADEKMIRSAVRSHFSSIQIDDELVTSYFDKLIQVPLRVPRLGVNEVKAYLILLFAQQALHKHDISEECYKIAKEKILDAIKKPWLGGLSYKVISEAFENCNDSIAKHIDMADQLANIMATQEQLAGNPRLIKRFLNNLVIRESIANAQGMEISFEALVKLQLFERCASVAAFDFLAKKVAESDDGKPEFIKEVEEKIKSGEEYEKPDISWDSQFIKDWLGIKPLLSDIDLRPYMHLSKDKVISLAGVDELSPEAREIYEALIVINSNNIHKALVEQIKSLGETEASHLFIRLKRYVASRGFNKHSLQGCLHIVEAYPNLNSLFLQLLSEIPPQKRLSSYIPILEKEPWTHELLKNWSEDSDTPKITIKAIKSKFKDK